MSILVIGLESLAWFSFEVKFFFFLGGEFGKLSWGIFVGL